MVDTKALFREAWDAELEKRQKESPSYAVEDYTVTGRAKAPYGRRNRAYWEDNGHQMVDAWVEWRKATRWDVWETPEGNPGIELELNVNLPGDIRVKMFIDRMFVTPVGELVVVDLKTGSRMPETAEQLGLYATGIELTWGSLHRPSWGYWWGPEKGHVGPFDLSMYTPKFFANTYAETARGINAGCFPAKPANNCKDWCGVAKYCAAVGGSEAAGVDPTLAP